tara:strand:- start:174 stop:1121 length:948 start_codon:yes stop_codon:yes gene_type:complete
MRNIKNICIVSGAHRSGTTWIGKTISKGTNSSYVWEPFNVNVPASQRISYGESFLKIKNWYHLLNGSNDEICNDLKNVFYKRKICLKKIISLLPVSFKENKKATLKWFLHNLKLSVDLKKKESAIIKDPIMLLSTKEICEALSCKCILITKDPRSFYNSLKKTSWAFDFKNILYPCLKLTHLNEFSNEVEEKINSGGLLDPTSIGLLWNILHKHIYYLSNFKQYKVVRYEDICKDPISQINELAVFATNKKLSKKTVKRLSIEQKNKVDNSYSFHMIRHENSKMISELWKSQLKEEEIYEIKKKCVKIMDIFCYE